MSFRLRKCWLTDRWKDKRMEGQKDRTDFITLTSDTGGKNVSSSTLSPLCHAGPHFWTHWRLPNANDAIKYLKKVNGHNPLYSICPWTERLRDVISLYTVHSLMVLTSWQPTWQLQIATVYTGLWHRLNTFVLPAFHMITVVNYFLKKEWPLILKINLCQFSKQLHPHCL